MITNYMDGLKQIKQAKVSIGEETLHAHLKAYNIAAEREYRFHPVRKWRFDFALPEKMLAIEVEGGSYMTGRHQTAIGFAKDCEKYNRAQLMGWKVLRFTTDMVKNGLAIAMIQEAII